MQTLKCLITRYGLQGMAACLCLVPLLQGGHVSWGDVRSSQTPPRHQAESKTTGKPRAVVYAAVSADGRLAASYYGKSKIHIWDKRTSKLLQTIKYIHSDDETYRFRSGEGLHFTPTGKWLYIKTVYALNLSSVEPAHDGESLNVWNTATGQAVLIPMGDEGTIRCMAFTPDESTLVYDYVGKFGASCILYKVGLKTNKYKELVLFSGSDINPQNETHLTLDGKIYTASGFGGPDKTVDVAGFKLMWYVGFY